MIGTGTARIRVTPYALGGLRIFVALIFVQHVTHKYFNVQSVPSFQGVDPTLHDWAGAIELFAGALLLLGLVTRPAAFIASGEMAVGYWLVHAP